MGKGVNGKDKLVSIHDGADPGGMIEVPHQGDTEFNNGKGVEISVQKNSKIPFETDEGATITFPIKKERPPLTAHTRLQAVADSGEAVAVEYADVNAGGESHSGLATVTMGSESTGTTGLLEQQVTISFVDDPVPGVS